MKLQYCFSVLFIMLKVVCSHPASSESDLQSEKIPGSSENSALDRMSLSCLDDSNTSTEKSRCDGEITATGIVCSEKHFGNSVNHEYIIEPFCSDPSYKSVEDLAKEYSSNDNFTIEIHHSNALSKEANEISNSITVGVIDGLLTNPTTIPYDERLDNTLAPSNTSYYINTGDIQEEAVAGVHEAVNLEAVRAIALEIPKSATEDTIADAENTHDNLSPSKNQDATQSTDFENVTSETNITEK